MERIFVKPCEGRKVRLEDGSLLPKEGAEVARTTYINRRLRAGDCCEVVSDSPAKKKKD